MLRKVSHIILIFFLLVTTVGLTVNLHYCKNKLYDIGVFSEATNCCVTNETNSHHNKTHAHPGCESEHHKPIDCEDETVQVKSVDDFVISSTSYNFNPESSNTLFLVYAVVINHFDFSDVNSSDKIPKQDISPPRIQEVLSFKQTYLL